MEHHPEDATRRRKEGRRHIQSFKFGRQIPSTGHARYQVSTYLTWKILLHKELLSFRIGLGWDILEILNVHMKAIVGFQSSKVKIFNLKL